MIAAAPLGVLSRFVNQGGDNDDNFGFEEELEEGEKEEETPPGGDYTEGDELV
ncbi:MAG: hypothetical protein HY456_01800 [Parcubacteria group bacterium]|nr:hypothetical protein [Parcubacteria group bacterium]